MTNITTQQLSIDRTQILAGLKLMTGILETSQVLPILGFIKLSIRNTNQLTLTTTDGEIKVSTRVNAIASNIESLDIAIPGKKFSDICKQLPSDNPIIMKFESPWVTIQQEKISFKLQTLDTQSFPEITIETEGMTRIEIEEKELQKLMQKTQFSMGHQDIRYYLNGVHMSIKDHKISATATDGHRLSFQHHQQESDHTFEFIIPRKAVLELNKQLEQHSEQTTKLGFSNQHLSIETPNFTMVTTTLKGQYPNCNHFQESSYDNAACVDVELLKRALQRASILSHDKFKAVKVTLSENQLIISAYNQEQENIHEAIAIQYDGPETTLGFNINYITDILGNIDTDMVEIQFTESEKRVLFSEPDRKISSSYIVMPLVI